jgi:hypothetical protein
MLSFIIHQNILGNLKNHTLHKEEKAGCTNISSAVKTNIVVAFFLTFANNKNMPWESQCFILNNFVMVETNKRKHPAEKYKFCFTSIIQIIY